MTRTTDGHSHSGETEGMTLSGAGHWTHTGWVSHDTLSHHRHNTEGRTEWLFDHDDKFAERQFKSAWDTAMAGAGEQLRQMAQFVQRAQADVDSGEVPGDDMQRIANRFAYWQAQLTTLQHVKTWVIDPMKEGASGG